MDYDKEFLKLRDNLAEALNVLRHEKTRPDLQVKIAGAMLQMGYEPKIQENIQKKLNAALVQMESAPGSYPGNAESYSVGGSKVVKHGGDTGWPDEKHPWRS